MATCDEALRQNEVNEYLEYDKTKYVYNEQSVESRFRVAFIDQNDIRFVDNITIKRTNRLIRKR